MSDGKRDSESTCQSAVARETTFCVFSISNQLDIVRFPRLRIQFFGHGIKKCRCNFTISSLVKSVLLEPQLREKCLNFLVIGVAQPQLEVNSTFQTSSATRSSRSRMSSASAMRISEQTTFTKIFGHERSGVGIQISNKTSDENVS